MLNEMDRLTVKLLWKVKKTPILMEHGKNVDQFF